MRVCEQACVVHLHGHEAVHLDWIACQGACPQGSQSPLFQQLLIAYDSYKDGVYQIFIIFILLFNVCVCARACTHAMAHIQRSEDNSWDYFALSTMWFLRIEHRLLGLVVNTFSCWTILPAQKEGFYKDKKYAFTIS